MCLTLGRGGEEANRYSGGKGETRTRLRFTRAVSEKIWYIHQKMVGLSRIVRAVQKSLQLPSNLGTT